jgi:hypothetical protein
MTFRVGQKVVCIDADFPHSMYSEYVQFPKKNGVYEIRGILPFVDPADGRQFIYLAGITNRKLAYLQGAFESAFPSNRFRPIVERKTDISVFTKMLTPEGVDA